MLSVELAGANLCSAAYDAPATFGTPQPIGNELNETLVARLADHFPLPDAVILPSDTYSFTVNRGAVAGTLSFVPRAPSAGVDIEAPADGATVGFHPAASGEFGCANCELARAWASEGDPLEPIGPSALFGIPHPGPFHVSSLDELTDAPGGLAAGTYGFEVEVIDGALVSDQTFGGDAGGIPFVYLSGTSELATVDFTVPEAGGTASAWVAATALAGCARVRGTRRRRR